MQPAQHPVLTINGTPISTIEDLKAILEKIAPGTQVKMTFESQGKPVTLETAAK